MIAPQPWISGTAAVAGPAAQEMDLVIDDLRDARRHSFSLGMIQVEQTLCGRRRYADHARTKAKAKLSFDPDHSAGGQSRVKAA